MKPYELTKKQSCEHLLKTIPSSKHYEQLIDEDTLFVQNGEPVGLYLKIKSEQLQQLREAVRSTKYVKTYRVRKALPTQSSVFGSLPRVPLRNDYCRFSNQTKKEPVNANTLFAFADVLAEVYKKYLPKNYENDLRLVNSNIDSSYLVSDNLPFTTANINVNHAIKYHRDTGNFKTALSNVLILRSGVTGGELVFPEYGFALSQKDSYLAIFNGQKEIHGVMPIKATSDSFYRASIVYYTLENMKHCYPYKEELKRLQNIATLRARKRASNIDPRTKTKVP